MIVVWTPKCLVKTDAMVLIPYSLLSCIYSKVDFCLCIAFTKPMYLLMRSNNIHNTCRNILTSGTKPQPTMLTLNYAPDPLIIYSTAHR